MHPRASRLLWLLLSLFAVPVQGGVPQVSHRLQGYSYSSFRGFDRLALRFAGGLPNHRLQEEKDGVWTLVLESTVAPASGREFSEALVRRLEVRPAEAELHIRLTPSQPQGMDVQAIRQQDLLLVDFLPRPSGGAREFVFEQGVKALEAGNAAEALRYLRQWIHEHPEDARAYFYAGRARLALGDVAKARYNFLRAARDSTWRKEVAKELVRMGQESARRAEATSVRSEPAKPSQTTALASAGDTPKADSAASLARADSTPSQTAAKPAVPSIDRRSVMVLFALPLLAAAGVLFGFIWILLRSREDRVRPRPRASGRFKELLRGFSGSPRMAAQAAADSPPTDASPEKVKAEVPQHPSADRRPAVTAEDLFLPLNRNDSTRIDTRRARQGLRPDLKELLASSQQGLDVRELARYLGVGLGEVELAQALAKKESGTSHGHTSRPASPKIRFELAGEPDE